MKKALSQLGHVDIRSGKYMTQIDGEILPQGGAINGTSIYVGRDAGNKGVRVAIVYRDGGIVYANNEIAKEAEKIAGNGRM